MSFEALIPSWNSAEPGRALLYCARVLEERRRADYLEARAAADLLAAAYKGCLEKIAAKRAAKAALANRPYAIKAAARAALRAMRLPEQQLNKALSAVTRATKSSTIDIAREGENVVASVTRPGANGYQAITSTVGPDGAKTVVQTVYDSAGNIVHYDPK